MKTNQKGTLTRIEPFKDECGKWWFRLFYEYEDEKGLHRVAYPKVEVPFFQTIVPFVNKMPKGLLYDLNTTKPGDRKLLIN